MRVYIILSLLVFYNAIGSQAFDKAFDMVVRCDVMKYCIIKYFCNHNEVSALKRTCTKFNDLYHYHMLDASTIAEIPEKICTKALVFFAKNNLDDNFNVFFENNNKEKREAMVPLLGWQIESERKNAYCQGLKIEQHFYWCDFTGLFKNSIALDITSHFINTHHDKNGNTALIIAAFHETCKDRVELLLKNNIDPNIQGKDGETALKWAVIGGNEEIVDLLLTNNAHINVQDKNGETALKNAVIYQRHSITKLLLKKGADPNIQDEEGVTPLMHAAEYGYSYIVKQLLKNNADLNMQDKDGYTALMIAVLNDCSYIVQQLIEKDADLTIKNVNGRTALEIAVNRANQHDDQNIRKLLEAAHQKLEATQQKK